MIEAECRTTVSLFCSLPELSLVWPWKERLVLLRLVLENRRDLPLELRRRDRHRHVELLDRPFLPRAAIKPKYAFRGPRVLGDGFHTFEDCGQAGPMGAVRIGEIPGRIDLMRLYLAEQVGDDFDVGFTQRLLGDSPRLVERKIQKMEMVVWHAATPTGIRRFDPTNQTLDLLDFRDIHFTGALLSQDVGHPPFQRFSLGRAESKRRIKMCHKVRETKRFAVEDRDVSRGLIGHVHFVSLIDQSDERSAHGDYVVIGMRAEDEDSLREDLVGRPIDITGPLSSGRLAAGPPRDRALNRAEDLEIQIVDTPSLGEEFLQAVLVVILSLDFENCLGDSVGQPDHRFLDQLLRPNDWPHRPRRRQPRKRCGRPLVQIHGRVGVLLKE